MQGDEGQWVTFYTKVRQGGGEGHKNTLLRAVGPGAEWYGVSCDDGAESLAMRGGDSFACASATPSISHVGTLVPPRNDVEGAPRNDVKGAPCNDVMRTSCNDEQGRD